MFPKIDKISWNITRMESWNWIYFKLPRYLFWRYTISQWSIHFKGCSIRCNICNSNRNTDFAFGGQLPGPPQRLATNAWPVLSYLLYFAGCTTWTQFILYSYSWSDSPWGRSGRSWRSWCGAWRPPRSPPRSPWTPSWTARPGAPSAPPCSSAPSSERKEFVVNVEKLLVKYSLLSIE